MTQAWDIGSFAIILSRRGARLRAVKAAGDVKGEIFETVREGRAWVGS